APCPLPTPDLSLQSQNDYLWEWLPHQQQYLDILLTQESPPDPRTCNICGGDGVYKCSDCFSQPIFCTSCCRQQHLLNPLHRIQQWGGKCFEDSSLSLAGFEVYLGHRGQSCPCMHGATLEPAEDPKLEDLDASHVPTHLKMPQGVACLTMVDVTGLHFSHIQYCHCPEAKAVHLQLLRVNMFPASIQNPSCWMTSLGIMLNVAPPP
ncbi:hypothetical protein PAXRUDRAFT_168162, partial [Paxillus rubicundulus Ve08.2h10]